MALFDRLLAPITRWLYQEPALVAGSGGTGSQPANKLYDAKNALSAMAAFPWFWACLDVISTDLSGVPLVAVHTDATGNRTILPSHPVLDMLSRPSPQCSGVAMRRQLYADFSAAREAYIRVLGTPGVDGVAIRLHPGDVTPNVDPRTGLIEHYDWGGQQIAPSEILMIRGIGWESGIRASRAESPVHSLAAGLTADQAARDFAKKAANSGQLEIMLKPSDPVAQFGKNGVKAVTDMYLTAKQAGHGMMVLNRALDVVPLSINSRDMEFPQLHVDVRDETLAVMGVPPVLVGLPGANYGTARQQSRTYWERRKHDAKLFDDELSRLTGDPSIRIEHDFTDIEALQTTRTERQDRAEKWVQGFGVKPAEAAAYEGFDDAPVDPDITAGEVSAMRPSAPTVNEPQETRSAEDLIGEWLHDASGRYELLAGQGLLDRSAEAMEAGLLTASLAANGHEPAKAARFAAGVAQTVHDAVSTIVDRSSADGVIGIKSLRVFGPEFAATVSQGLAA